MDITDEDGWTAIFGLLILTQDLKITDQDLWDRLSRTNKQSLFGATVAYYRTFGDEAAWYYYGR